MSQPLFAFCDLIHFALRVQQSADKMVRGHGAQILENEDHAHLMLVQHLEDFLVLLPPVMGDQDRIVLQAPEAVFLV